MSIDSWQQTVSGIERVVISSCIRYPEKNGVFAGELTTEQFSDPRHRAIYATILELFNGMEPVDGWILKSRLIRKGILEEAGGEGYLDELIKADTTGIDFGYYVGMITESAGRRHLRRAGLAMAARADDMTVSMHDTWEKAVDELMAMQKDYRRKGPVRFEKILQGQLSDIWLQVTNGGPVKGVPTGYRELDNKLRAFMPGELMVVAGRPSMGKSSLVLSMLHHICGELRKPVAMVSLECSKEIITQRLLSQVTGLPHNRIRSGELTETEWQKLAQKAEEINHYPLYILDPPFATPSYLRMEAIRLVQKYGVEMLVIDYLQLMKVHRKTYMNRELEIAEVCRSLKTIARELEIPVLVVSQLSRAVETRGGDKRPVLSDLRESGSIEQEADKVLFIYRGEYYGLDTDWEGRPTKNVADIIVGKNRTGPVCTVSLRFDPRTARFLDSEDYRPEEMDPDVFNENELINKHHKLFNNNENNEEETVNVPF